MTGAVRQIVYTGSVYDVFSGSLSQVVQFLQDKLLEVPEEHRANAVCDTETSSEGSAEVEISYWRPETTSERGERLAKEERHAIADREHELRVLRALKEKYGG